MAERQMEILFHCDALGAELWVTSFHAVEALSTPTRGTLHALASSDLDGEAALGQPAHVEIRFGGEPVRHFQLVVVAFRFAGLSSDARRRYVVDLAHELAPLALRADVRMFQEKDAKAIVAEVLDGAGIAADHLSWSIRRTLTKRTYCVQYRERDLDFVSRLLEHEGIFYFIRDDDGATTVTFADAQDAFPPVDGDTAIPFVEDALRPSGVTHFEIESAIMPAKATVGDYDFEIPDVDLTKERGVQGSVVGDVFEYPAGFQKPDEGLDLAEIRLQELLAQSRVGHGQSDKHVLAAGAWFELEDAGALSGKYLITAVEHHFDRGAFDSTSHAYENDFTVIPFDHPYRPPRNAARAHARGPHSAVVTGPAGSEIHPDELGRMKGHFFWDRVGPMDDTSSCWMRVAQLPISGSVALARVGWEMEVCYFDGSPDRPIAVSRLYNAEKASPYAYPAAKTRMAFQTPSSPGGGKSNELRMEDGGGGMELFVNASKDYDEQTNNDKTEKVGVDETVDVGVDQEITVVSNESITIGGSRTEKVSADAGLQVKTTRTKTVGGSETVTVSGNIGATVDGSDTEIVGGSHTTSAVMGINKTCTGGLSLTVGGSMISAAGLGVSVAILGAKAETVGGAKIVASASKVTETVIGAYAGTVGGVQVHAAATNRLGSTKGASALTVGGVMLANAGGKLTMKAKTINITVAGMVNLLGGGGIVNLTPASCAFVGMVTLDASGGIKISGNPNLVG
jgi:type VI secretion system secreted protein VgrG